METGLGRGIESLEKAYGIFLTGALIVLAILVMLCLVRAIIGPRVADRIVSVNMTGTMVIVMIGILTLMLGEGYLADICIIYAMISFLAVIVLVKVYMGVYLAGKQEKTREEEDGGGSLPGQDDTHGAKQMEGIDKFQITQSSQEMSIGK